MLWRRCCRPNLSSRRTPGSTGRFTNCTNHLDSGARRNDSALVGLNEEKSLFGDENGLCYLALQFGPALQRLLHFCFNSGRLGQHFLHQGMFLLVESWISHFLLQFRLLRFQ